MRKEVSIEVNRKRGCVPEGITLKTALEISGYRISKYPDEGSLFMPCEVGGCWSCAVEVNKEIKPAWMTPVEDGLEIKTDLPRNHTPKRVVHRFSGHTVGGVGTPWWLKSANQYTEAVCFSAGCNLGCPQCQNWETTYPGKDKAGHIGPEW